MGEFLMGAAAVAGTSQALVRHRAGRKLLRGKVRRREG
jgi:hypothetical protein